MSTSIDFNDASKQALTNLTAKWYNSNPPSQYGSAYWIQGSFLWQSANALETLLDYQIRTGDATTFADTISGVYSAFQPSFYAGWFGYYDDEAWWGISCLKAYQVTQQKDWLTLAQQIYADLQGGWDDVCGGGIWFKRDPKDYSADGGNFKGDISNELMLVLAARLYNDPSTGSSSAQLEWAIRTWNWFRDSGLIGSDQLMIDSLDADCKPVINYPWTYTQGVIIGGAIELYKATGDKAYLLQAIRTADATLRMMIWPSGILQERCEQEGTEAPCDNNATLFKGIFMRYLSYLYDTLSSFGTVYADTLLRYKTFIELNATTIWTQYPKATFGLNWNGGSTEFGPVVQISASNALLAAAATTPKESQ